MVPSSSLNHSSESPPRGASLRAKKFHLQHIVHGGNPEDTSTFSTHMVSVGIAMKQQSAGLGSPCCNEVKHTLFRNLYTQIKVWQFPVFGYCVDLQWRYETQSILENKTNAWICVWFRAKSCMWLPTVWAVWWQAAWSKAAWPHIILLALLYTGI